MKPFRVTSEPIDAAACAAALTDVRAGAFATFEGRVRDHSDGGTVSRLDYEAYVPLVEKEGERILAEAAAKFRILRAGAVHRIGALALGDVAVWVGVASEHREDAFGACRYIIDETKARLPIWKREHFQDGRQEWINAAIRGASADAAPGSRG
jgi:molybdopterin synthase catalytic subunit